VRFACGMPTLLPGAHMSPKRHIVILLHHIRRTLRNRKDDKILWERRGTRVPSVFQSLQRAARRLTLRRPSTTEPSGKKQPDHAVASRDSVRPRSRLPFKLGLVTMVLSLCSGLATYVILSGLTPIVPTNLVVVVVLLINLVLVLAMLGIIAWQVTGLWLAKR